MNHSDKNQSFLKELFKKDEKITFFEVGCADGDDSIKFLNNFPNIKLYCFEADPRAIHIHKKYINDKRCILIENAVSDSDDYVNFKLGNTNKNNKKLNTSKVWHDGKSDRLDIFKEATKVYNKLFDQKSSTVTENGWFYSSSISNTIKNSPINQSKVITIKSITLDSFCKNNNIKNIDFLWTDVEAAEKKVILGAKETLKITKYLMLEFGLKYIFKEAMDKEETIKFMKNFNFTPIKTIENNIIFKNDNYSQLSHPS